MDNKKILLIFVVIIAVAVVAAAAVVMSNANTVKVGGLDFNIPEGFVQNESTSQHKVYAANDSDIPINTTESFFSKGEDRIFIIVIDCDSQDNAKKIYEMSTSKVNITKTINGHEGAYSEQQGVYVFQYVKDKYNVVVSANNETLFEGLIS